MDKSLAVKFIKLSILARQSDIYRIGNPIPTDVGVGSVIDNFDKITKNKSHGKINKLPKEQ